MGDRPSQPLSPFLVYVLAKSEGGEHPLGARASKAIRHARRRGVDWLTWRVVAHARVPDGLVDVRRRWSLADLLDAHLALDAIDAVDAIAAESRR